VRLATAMLGVLLVGCGGVASPESAQQVTGRSFESISVTEDGEPRPLVDEPIRAFFIEPLDAQRQELATLDGQLDAGAVVLFGWTSGCNTHNTFFEVSAQQLREVTLEDTGGGSTAMGCEPLAKSDEEAWLSQFFSETLRWELRDGRLLLSANNVEVELQETDAPVPQP
jgi:hypothetical protein